MIPNAYYENIFKIDYDKLKRIGIKNLFFDIDNTIIPYKEKEVNKKTINFFKDLSKDFNIFLFSNSRKKRALNISNQLGVGVYYFSMKPLKRNYKKILNVIKKEDSIFIGDQFMTDVLGAKRNGLKVIFVDKLARYEPIGTKFWRLLERHYLRKYKKKNIFKLKEYYDRLKNV